MRKGWAPIAWSRDAYGGGGGIESGEGAWRREARQGKEQGAGRIANYDLRRD